MRPMGASFFVIFFFFKKRLFELLGVLHIVLEKTDGFCKIIAVGDTFVDGESEFDGVAQHFVAVAVGELAALLFAYDNEERIGAPV